MLQLWQTSTLIFMHINFITIDAAIASLPPPLPPPTPQSLQAFILKRPFKFYKFPHL